MLGYDYDDYTPIYTHIELGKNKYLITTTINTLVFKELKMDEFGQYDKNTVIN